MNCATEIGPSASMMRRISASSGVMGAPPPVGAWHENNPPPGPQSSLSPVETDGWGGGSLFDTAALRPPPRCTRFAGEPAPDRFGGRRSPSTAEVGRASGGVYASRGRGAAPQRKPEKRDAA